jgi:GWxTD domain-containing protein
MTALAKFVGTPLSAAIGWTLLHSIWEGALIAALLAAILAFTRSSRVRYAAACIAMISMLCGFALTIAHLLPEQGTELPSLRMQSYLAWTTAADARDSSAWTLSLQNIAPWLGPFWISGVWLVCALRLMNWFAVQRLRTRGVCSASDNWQRELARLSARLGVKRMVMLLESCLADVPILIGHFRPVILMPIGLLSGLPASQVEAILLHELAHIKRRDYLVNLMQRLAEGLLFYHPAAWWISHVIRIEREKCCDDLVVSVTQNPHEYATALAALEHCRTSRREPAVAATGGHLMNRIHRLLYPAKPKNGWGMLVGVAIFLVTGTACLAAWQARPSDSTRPDLRGQSDRTESYSKWLNEDVVYIIDDAERAAFERLTSNEERDQFIAQFWARRSSTQGESGNKFKEEHYRRLAYATEHFRTASGAPGWRTDRGHMYIVYGPPDEIEAHAKKSDQSFATEVWLYQQVRGVGNKVAFTFIDQTGRGDFHLAPQTIL